MDEDELDELYDKRFDAIAERVERELPGGRVEHSAFGEDDDGLPVDNLDEIAVKGRARFIQKHDPFFGKGSDYRSDVVEDPTWLDVLRLADEMIATTGDEHHIYLEDLEFLRDEDGVRVYEFVMGS